MINDDSQRNYSHANNPLINTDTVEKQFQDPVHIFFYKQPIFRLSLELLSEVPKMRLKIAMKLLTFFGDYRLK